MRNYRRIESFIVLGIQGGSMAQEKTEDSEPNYFEENRKIQRELKDKYGPYFSFNAKAINVHIQALSMQDQENITHYLFDNGYRMNRIGEFSDGKEFAEFIPQE